MKTRVPHVARETLRAAFRSRFVLGLAALLAVVLVVLPRAVGGDGSPEGARRLALTWTLGLSAIVLSAATLWAGCGAIAGEMEERTWSALCVTPAARLELWLGKWAGLVALDALLLVPVLFGVALQLRVRGVPAESLRPYERVAPAPSSILAEAKRSYAAAVSAGAFAAETNRTPEQIVHAIYHDLMEHPLSLSGGGHFSWMFPLPSDGPASDGRPAILRLTLVSPFGTAADTAGALTALTETDEIVASREISPDDNRELSLDIPPASLSGLSALVLRFDNTGSADAPAALFHPAEDAVLLLPRGTFAGNLVRAGLTLLALLSTLAALGTAAGALFSRPVAIFVATGIVVLGLVAHSDIDADLVDRDDPVAAAQPEFAYAVRARRVLNVVAAFTAPVAEARPLDRAGDDDRIPARPVVRAVVQDGIVLPLVLGALSVVALRRRTP